MKPEVHLRDSYRLFHTESDFQLACADSEWEDANEIAFGFRRITFALSRRFERKPNASIALIFLPSPFQDPHDGDYGVPIPSRRWCAEEFVDLA